MNAPSPASLKAASIALADDDENVDLALAIKVAALIDAEREACAKLVEDHQPEGCTCEFCRCDARGGHTQYNGDVLAAQVRGMGKL